MLVCVNRVCIFNSRKAGLSLRFIVLKTVFFWFSKRQTHVIAKIHILKQNTLPNQAHSCPVAVVSVAQNRTELDFQVDHQPREPLFAPVCIRPPNFEKGELQFQNAGPK